MPPQLFLLAVFFVFRAAMCKYTEGILKTSENWAFLARFCFFPHKGHFRYILEFGEDQDGLNLLLYYDEPDQWQAVYKTDKNCREKESVLHLEQLQVINLTMRHPYARTVAGCEYAADVPASTASPRYTVRLPTIKRKIAVPNGNTASTTTSYDVNSTEVPEEEVTTTAMPLDGSTLESTVPTEETTEVLSVERPKRELPSRPSFTYNARASTIVCENRRSFLSSRARWWYLALSHCNATKGIHVRYRVWMTNGRPGDFWHEHFSADEFYTLPILMAFTITYSFLLLGVLLCAIELKSRQLLHATYKIFAISVVFQLFGVLLSTACSMRYAVSGVWPMGVKRTGAMLMSISETLFLLLLLLLAKGYTVTRGRLPIGASVKLTVFMCCYVITYLSIFSYEANVFDPGEVLYLYESPAGYGLIILRLLAWCMFIYSTIFTLKHYPEKSNFYYPFNICGTLWFVAGPAFILAANNYIDKWVRESIVCAVTQLITFGGHAMFIVLTTPSVANKNFPYHVRTTQISVMAPQPPEGAQNGSDSGEDGTFFSHHVYEPTIIVPLTRRTEQLLSQQQQQMIESQNDIRRDSLNIDSGNTRNLMMDNVISWSLARNPEAIEMPDLMRHHHRSSLVSTGSNGNASTISQRQSSPASDYVIREVPVQLFTIHTKPQ